MDDRILYNFEDVKIPDFNPEFFGLWINGVAKRHDKEIKELSYIFCSDDYLLRVNKEYLNHDDYTDIITFNYNEESSLSGDLFISYERVVDNARDANVSIFDELCRVMIHGVLHLIGFNDKSDAEQTEMTKKENECLEFRNCFT